MRPKLTLCVITKDEEDRIGDCLDSASFADHVVVVDSGSSDRTREIAEEKGATVVVHDFDGHVQQKNRAVDLAETDWVLCLDADERVTPALRDQIEEALDTADLPVAFSMPRRTFYLGRWIDHGGWYPDRKVRVFDRRKARWGGVNPHDRVEVDGEVRALAGDIAHYSYRSISDHLKQIDFFTTISAKEKLAAGMKPRLWRLLLHPVGKVLRMYFLKLGFLDGRAGFIVAVLGGTYVFLKYAKHWELSRRPAQDSAPDHARDHARDHD
ncbi:MAG: glycosyltransferase family 2 protein [Planctomycetota bacterium]